MILVVILSWESSFTFVHNSNGETKTQTAKYSCLVFKVRNNNVDSTQVPSGSKRSRVDVELDQSLPTLKTTNQVQNVLRHVDIEVDLDNLPADPGLRIRIFEYHPNVRD